MAHGHDSKRFLRGDYQRDKTNIKEMGLINQNHELNLPPGY